MLLVVKIHQDHARDLKECDQYCHRADGESEGFVGLLDDDDPRKKIGPRVSHHSAYQIVDM